MEAGVAAGFKEFETAFKTLVEAVSTLNQEQEKLTESVLGQRLAVTSNGGPQAQEFNQLITRVKLLKARMPATSGGRLGDDAFWSRLYVLALLRSTCPPIAFICSTMW
jgi:hypothetical protein